MQFSKRLFNLDLKLVHSRNLFQSKSVYISRKFQTDKHPFRMGTNLWNHEESFKPFEFIVLTNTKIPNSNFKSKFKSTTFINQKRCYTCCKSNSTEIDGSNTCGCSSQSHLQSQSTESLEPKQKVTFQFLDRDDTKVECVAFEGDLLSTIASKNYTTLECACGESLSCSTCHVYLPIELYDTLDFPTDGEDDILDQALGLVEDSSRLACQVRITKDFQGKTITIPKKHINLLD